MPTQWDAGPLLWETATGAIPGSGRLSYLPGLKEDYIEAFDIFLNSPMNVAANRFARRRDRMGGRRTVTEVPTQRPAGVGNRGEYERLPFATASASTNLYITPKKQAMRHRMTWELMAAAAKGDSVVFERDPWSRDMEQLREGYALFRNEMIISGRYDVLGVVSAYSAGASGAATFTLYGRNAGRSTAAAFYRRGAFPHPFAVGQWLSIVDVSADGIYGAIVGTGGIGTVAGSGGVFQVTAIGNSDQEAPTVTVQNWDNTTGLSNSTALATALNITPADGDYLIPGGDRRFGGTFTDAAINDTNLHAMNGIPDFFAGSGHSGTVMGGSKTSITGLVPNHMVGSPAGTQRAFAERGVGMLIRLGQQKSGKTINRLYNDPSIMDEWFKENANLRRFETVMGKSGFDDLKIMMHGVMVGPDIDWQAFGGKVYGYNTGFGGYYEQRPLGPPVPGEERWVQDYDLRESILLQSGNIMRTRPFGEGLYDDIIFNAYDLTP